MAESAPPLSSQLLPHTLYRFQAKMGSAYKMIPIPLAQSIVLENTWTLSPETVTLAEALGRTLAAQVVAPDSVPPFPASIKDGYAVLSSDGAGEFEVIGESRAGNVDDVPMGPGLVAYITTGAPVPPGSDAVVQVEDTEILPSAAGSSKRIRIKKAAVPGQDIRQIGSDIMVGETVLMAGDVVGVAEIGILATVGATQVQVFGQPHVGIMSTGDEVVDPSVAHLAPGQIRDANRSMLMAAAAKAGAKVTDLGIARDSEGHIEGCFERAAREGVDVLITSGGVSMGDKDLVKPLLERRGTVHFGRVLMKPGKPLTFATLSIPASEARPARNMMVFGLPGNPVSSFACFHLVALPALRKMMGWAQPSLRRVQVRLAQTLKLDPERPEYHRVTLQWSRCPNNIEGGQPDEFSWWAVSTGNQISSRLLSARSANALLEIPRASGSLVAGSDVSALLIDDLQMMPVPHAIPATPGFEL